MFNIPGIGVIGAGGISSPSSAASSQETNTSKTFTFGAPQINKTDYVKLALLVGGGVIAYALFKKIKK